MDREIIMENDGIGYVELGNAKVYVNLVLDNSKPETVELLRTLLDEEIFRLVIVVSDDDIGNGFSAMTFGKVLFTIKLIELLELTARTRNRKEEDTDGYREDYDNDDAS